jgi:hypothetical protein
MATIESLTTPFHLLPFEQQLARVLDCRSRRFKPIITKQPKTPKEQKEKTPREKKAQKKAIEKSQNISMAQLLQELKAAALKELADAKSNPSVADNS